MRPRRSRPFRGWDLRGSARAVNVARRTAAISLAPHLRDDGEVLMLGLCVGYLNENDFSPIYLLAR